MIVNMETDCVMLAAGISERMGTWKMILPFADSTIIECSIRNALSVCDRIILVTGHRAREIESLLSTWNGVEVIRNPDYVKGMFSSVKAGAALVKAQRFFLALGDMPLVSPDVYRTLLEYNQMDVVIPKYRGKKGHPLLLSRGVADCIAGFDEEKTLRNVLARFPTLAVPVESQSVLHDIDNREDYNSFMKVR